MLDQPIFYLVRQLHDGGGGIQGQGQFLAGRRLQRGELAVDQAGRHEMPWAVGDAVGGGFAGQFEKYEAKAGNGIAQGLAILDRKSVV